MTLFLYYQFLEGKQSTNSIHNYCKQIFEYSIETNIPQFVVSSTLNCLLYDSLSPMVHSTSR